MVWLRFLDEDGIEEYPIVPGMDISELQRMENEMELIIVRDMDEIPAEYTGIVKSLTTKNTFYYKNGKVHRENGPAIETSDGGKYWYKNEKAHREDGPAVEFSDGYKEWWVDGFLYAEIRPHDTCVDFHFNLKDYIFLESWIGNYGLKWMKLLTEDEIIELPLISEMRFSQQQLDFFIKNKVLDGNEVNDFVYFSKLEYFTKTKAKY